MEAADTRGPIGRDVLDARCTVCHDSPGLEPYKDYWGEPEWRSLIDTMISYGAVLSDEEYEALAKYLGEFY